MLQPLKNELERMMKISVIRKLHINEVTDWVHNLVLFWMDAYFGDLNEGTHVIADDVKIHSDSKSTHDLHLLEVLNQCRKIGLKLNADKCIFKATSIPFFGHVISSEGVQPHPAKLDAIKNMPTPTSKHDFEFPGFMYLSVHICIWFKQHSSPIATTHKECSFLLGQ